MKYLITILLFAICHIGQAQQTVLTNDPTIAIPKVNFDEKGELKITASATSSPNDFDFLVGKSKSLGDDVADAVIFNSPFSSKFTFGIAMVGSLVRTVC